jgi:hypothetical protein
VPVEPPEEQLLMVSRQVRDFIDHDDGGGDTWQCERYRPLRMGGVSAVSGAKLEQRLISLFRGQGAYDQDIERQGAR